MVSNLTFLALKKNLKQIFKRPSYDPSGESKQKNGSSSSLENGADSQISSPYNVSHRVHVHLDHKTGAFSGVPEPWLDILYKEIRLVTYHSEHYIMYK